MGKRRTEDMAGLLKARGTPTKELASRAGLSIQTAYNLLSGRGDVKTDTLQSIAKALQVPIERVLLAFRVNRRKSRRRLAGLPSAQG